MPPRCGFTRTVRWHRKWWALWNRVTRPNHTPNLTGVDGVERSFNSKLSGVDGWRVTEADHSQRERVAWRVEDVGARDGLNVVLTVDSAIQHIVETALAEAAEKHTPKSITGIVAIRPSLGGNPGDGLAAGL